MKNLKFTYTNDEKLNQMLYDQKRFRLYATAFAALAISSEIYATMYAPALDLAGLAIINTIGTGIYLTKINNIKEKIKKYKEEKENS